MKILNFNRFKRNSLGLLFKMIKLEENNLSLIKNKKIIQLISKLNSRRVILERKIVGHTDTIICLLLLLNNNQVASGSQDKTIMISNLCDGKVV